MQSKNYMKFPINFLDGAGLSPNSKIHRKILSLCVFLPMVLVITHLTIRKFWDTKGDILVIAEVFESLTTCAQLILRKYLMYIHGKLIIEIMEDRRQFWDYNLFGSKSGKNFQKKLIICIRIAKIVVRSGVMTIGIFCITTIIDDTKIVPLMCLLPSSKIAIAIIYASQVLIMLELMYILLGWDCFFLLMCTDLRIQFILLHKMLKTIDFVKHEGDSLKKFILCTKHHRFLLRVHQKLNTVFSEYFIVLYIVTVASASIHYYIVMYRSPGLGDSIKSLCYLTGMLFQVALFFIISSNLEIEVRSFDEIYDLNWEYTNNLKIRKNILFMLMKSQESVCMEGGGMVHINRNEYVALCRLAFSIATLLGGMN